MFMYCLVNKIVVSRNLTVIHYWDMGQGNIISVYYFSIYHVQPVLFSSTVMYF